MPLPTPRSDESEDDFIERCMGDSEAVSDFPDASQRRAVCQTQFDEARDEDGKSVISKVTEEMRDFSQKDSE